MGKELKELDQVQGMLSHEHYVAVTKAEEAYKKAIGEAVSSVDSQIASEAVSIQRVINYKAMRLNGRSNAIECRHFARGCRNYEVEFSLDNGLCFLTRRPGMTSKLAFTACEGDWIIINEATKDLEICSEDRMERCFGFKPPECDDLF